MMYLIDAGRVVLFCGYFFWPRSDFFGFAWGTHKTHLNDPVVQQHFAEHAIAAALAFLGSLIGVIYSVVHLFSIRQGELPETPFSVAILLLLLSGIAFMQHMIKEQTPGHPFYVRENSK